LASEVLKPAFARNSGFSRIDYFALVDAVTLDPVAEPKERCA
jgi:hypothetical protein